MPDIIKIEHHPKERIRSSNWRVSANLAEKQIERCSEQDNARKIWASLS